MDGKIVIKKQPMGAMELLGVIGAACFYCSMMLSFFWLFPLFADGVTSLSEACVQSCMYLGLPLGYALQHFASKRPAYRSDHPGILLAALICSMLFPAACIVLLLFTRPPLPILCVTNLLTGLAASYFIVAWIDVCTRIRVVNHLRFTGTSLFAATIASALLAFAPSEYAPVACACCAAISTALLWFITKRSPISPENEELMGLPVRERAKDNWRHLLEIEPSFIVFGIAFGFTFYYLASQSAANMRVGMLFCSLGALTIVLIANARKSIKITTMQRTLIILIIIFCVSLSFVPFKLTLFTAGLVVAGWAAFVAVNHSFMVEKSLAFPSLAAFRQVPIHLILRAFGFVLGWFISAVLGLFCGQDSTAFSLAAVVLAIAVVIVVMVFYPQERHHQVTMLDEVLDEDFVPACKVQAPADATHEELFKMRCNAAGKLYGLSPREIDVLCYLAKGRNARYIEEHLMVSGHTVKSHIHKIYQKFDIHSQQNLMDFIEGYPLD